MLRICAWCIPQRVIEEIEPLDDPGETHGICPECYKEYFNREEVKQ